MYRVRDLLVPASLTVTLAASVSALPPPATSLNTCQDKVRSEGGKYEKSVIAAVSTCLKAVAIDVIKNNVAITAATSAKCVKQFRKINDTRIPPADVDFEAKLRAKVDSKCVPGFTPSQTHMIDDVTDHGLGLAPQHIKTANMDTWCKHFGGDGSIDSVTEWEDCIVKSHNCEAAAAIHAQYPRALEWITALQSGGNMGSVPSPVSDPGRTADALAAAAAFQLLLDPNVDGTPNPTCGGEGVACTTFCCYIENTAPNSPETSCIEYTGPAAAMATFTGFCAPAATNSFPAVFAPGGQVHTAVPGPCGAAPSPVNANPCFVGVNKMFAPADSSCP